jgi:uncharacterized protein (DUF885 family)
MRTLSRLSHSLIAAAGISALAIVGVAQTRSRPAATSGPDAQLDRLVDTFLEQRWQASPASATDAGVPGYDDKLPDFSPQAISARTARQRDLLGAVQRLDERTLSPEARIDRQLLIAQLDSALRDTERRRPAETDPELYVPFSALSALVDRPGPVAERARSLRARLDALPALLEQGRANLKNPAQRFTQAAAFTVSGTLSFLKETVPAFAAQAGADGDDLRAAADKAAAALASFRKFLDDDLLSRSTGSWVMGREDYDLVLKRRWFLDADAPMILARGREAFADIERQLQKTAERISPGTPWVQVYERIKDDHPPAERLKDAYQAQMDAARAYLKAHDIVTLPAGERVETIDTPPAMRRSSPFGTFHSVGPFDHRMLGQLVLTPIEESLSPEQRAERLRSHHTAWIPIIAVHEAYPGHHVQALKANENPRVLRRIVRESIFSEGWGLYCEELMWEQGFLKGDDVRLTELRNRLWRAARVIIDVGIHTGSMTFDEGVQFLVDKIRFERYAAELEVGMYARRPTMVLGYLIGMQEIGEMRAAWERKYGKPAVPKIFFDRLLRIGAIPPGLVRRELLESPPS